MFFCSKPSTLEPIVWCVLGNAMMYLLVTYIPCLRMRKTRHTHWERAPTLSYFNQFIRRTALHLLAELGIIASGCHTWYYFGDTCAIRRIFENRNFELGPWNAFVTGELSRQALELVSVTINSLILGSQCHHGSQRVTPDFYYRLSDLRHW